jgi:hypothetical protein
MQPGINLNIWVIYIEICGMWVMPLLKIFVYADICFPKSKKAAILVIAMKPNLPCSEGVRK